MLADRMDFRLPAWTAKSRSVSSEARRPSHPPVPRTRLTTLILILMPVGKNSTEF